MKKVNITLIFLVMVLVANAQTYHEDDKEGLRLFLAQPSAIEGKTNGEQLGLTQEDMQSWQNNEDWVSKVVNLTWNDDSPKRIVGINWTSEYYIRNLAGVLDTKNWEKLRYLYCANNKLEGFSINSNEILHIQIQENPLSYLNISGCTNLKYLGCSSNKLTNLDLSEFINLESLFCLDNYFKNLDLSGCTNLRFVNCSFNNSLTELNLNGCNNLESLNCSCCYSLTNMDVSGCVKLQILNCNLNSLINLDLKTNSELSYLYCSENKLTELELNSNVNLIILGCNNNHIKLSNLYYISEKIVSQYGNWLGSQTLLQQNVTIGEEIDLSEDAVLGGMETVFVVNKNGEKAFIDEDYTIYNGIIIFLTEGAYTVTMTNDAIVSHPDYPVKVIAEFLCISSGIFNDVQEQTLTCYVENGILYIIGLSAGEKWRVYNVAGVLVAEGGRQEAERRRQKAEDEDIVVILPGKGIYIIKTEKRKMKIVI